MKRWPTWMLATGALASSSLLMWKDCSTEFQGKLKDLGCQGVGTVIAFSMI